MTKYSSKGSISFKNLTTSQNTDNLVAIDENGNLTKSNVDLNSIDTSNLVPYVGATQDLVMGNFQVRSNSIIQGSRFSGIGSNPELFLFNTSTNKNATITINPSQPSGVSFNLPASSGTIALTSDIPTYEEGTFTPTLTDSSGGATYSGVMQGEYIRTGNLVYFNISLSGISTTGTPSGFLNIANLPFVVDNLSVTSGACAINQLQGVNVNYYSACASVIDPLNLIRIAITTSASSKFTTLSSATFTSGIIVITGTYKTNVYTP